jgi:chromosomal replication initiation ATPase DnaA
MTKGTMKNVRKIATRAAKEVGFNLPMLLRPIRHKSIAEARKLAMYLVRVKGGASLHETGYVFQRDHSCVVNAVSWVRQELVRGNQQVGEIVERFI